MYIPTTVVMGSVKDSPREGCLSPCPSPQQETETRESSVLETVLRRGVCHFKSALFHAVFSLACPILGAICTWCCHSTGAHLPDPLVHPCNLCACLKANGWTVGESSREVYPQKRVLDLCRMTFGYASYNNLDIQVLCWKLPWKWNNMVGIFHFTIS